MSLCTRFFNRSLLDTNKTLPKIEVPNSYPSKHERTKNEYTKSTSPSLPSALSVKTELANQSQGSERSGLGLINFFKILFIAPIVICMIPIIILVVVIELALAALLTAGIASLGVLAGLPIIPVVLVGSALFVFTCVAINHFLNKEIQSLFSRILE